MNMYKKYKNMDGSDCEKAIIKIDGGYCIPFDPANTDYQAYLKWLSEGNEPLPADEPLPVGEPIPTDEPLPADEPSEG